MVVLTVIIFPRVVGLQCYTQNMKQSLNLENAVQKINFQFHEFIDKITGIQSTMLQF